MKNILIAITVTFWALAQNVNAAATSDHRP